MFETPESSSDLKARQCLVKPPLVAPEWPIRVLAPNWLFTSSQGCCTGPGQTRRPRLPRPVCLLCVQRKKPTLNGSKNMCCTFSQVVGQKLFRTGSCHHRFQVKPLFISRSLLIFFFFLVKASCSVRDLGVSTRISVCMSGIMFPENKQPASQRGFQSPQISLRCSQLAPLFQVTDPRRKPRWPETGRSAQRVRQNLLKCSPCTSSSSPVLKDEAAFHPCKVLRQAWESASLSVRPGLDGCEQLSFLFLNTKLSVKTCKGFTVSPRGTGDI